LLVGERNLRSNRRVIERGILETRVFIKGGINKQLRFHTPN